MAFYFDSYFTELGVAVTVLFAAAYVYLSWSWTYWKKRGVPQIEPSFPWGNFTDFIFMRKNIGLIYQDIYRLSEREKLVGAYMFSKPTLMLRDPELIKASLVKDFNNFHDRGFYDDSDREPLAKHLFFISGQTWRNLRVKLSPTFTSGKMKMMFPVLCETGLELQEYLKKPARSGEVIEIKDILARYSTDIIASCAFGIQCNCLKNPDAEFRQWGKKALDSTLGSTLFLIFATLAPSVLKLISFLPIKFTNPEATSYFFKMVKQTVSFRENNNVSRNDFMQLLIQLKNKGFVDVDKEEKNGLQQLAADMKYTLSIEDVAAQAFVFFLAGFETSSTTMMFCLYELSLNPELQRRLQEEIDSVLGKHNGKMTYEAVLKMQYLDKVVSETLRKYPPLPMLNREVTSAFKVPDTDIVLEKGTSVLIPILALQNDPKYFPEPERFDPERFTEEEKTKRHHYTYLPFGEGPRICIGMRFALLQTKVGLISVLSRYNLQVCEKTPIPLKINPKLIITTPTGGMWLKITERENNINID